MAHIIDVDINPSIMNRIAGYLKSNGKLERMLSTKYKYELEQVMYHYLFDLPFADQYLYSIALYISNVWKDWYNVAKVGNVVFEPNSKGYFRTEYWSIVQDEQNMNTFLLFIRTNKDVVFLYKFVHRHNLWKRFSKTCNVKLSSIKAYKDAALFNIGHITNFELDIHPRMFLITKH